MADAWLLVPACLFSFFNLALSASVVADANATVVQQQIDQKELPGPTSLVRTAKKNFMNNESFGAVGVAPRMEPKKDENIAKMRKASKGVMDIDSSGAVGVTQHVETVNDGNMIQMSFDATGSQQIVSTQKKGSLVRRAPETVESATVILKKIGGQTEGPLVRRALDTNHTMERSTSSAILEKKSAHIVRRTKKNEMDEARTDWWPFSGDKDDDDDDDDDDDAASSGPRDCVTGWKSWSKCSKSCDGGTKSRSAKIVRLPKDGGSPCILEDDEEKECNVEPCSEAPLFKNWAQHGCSVQWQINFVVVVLTALRMRQGA